MLSCRRMKHIKLSSNGNEHLQNPSARAPQSAASQAGNSPGKGKSSAPPVVATSARPYANPVDYTHPYESMRRFAQFLALHYDANRTRHAYYRQLRLIHEHLGADPATLTETQLRDYFLFVKLNKHWQPKSIRQAVAASRMFFVDLLNHSDWTVFSQIRTRDHDTLPAVITRQQVHDLLSHIRRRRYRTPIKLIYCCGLRLSECLGLTVHDIVGSENKLFIRKGKGQRDRVLPLPTSLYEELRNYWRFHHHPLLIFPNVGRGRNDPKALAARMRAATSPMPYSSLQRLLVVAREELNLPAVSPHSLRHCFATHLLEAGAHLHTIQKLLGHKQITTTMLYLHLTHQTSQDALRLMDQICRRLPR